MVMLSGFPLGLKNLENGKGILNRLKKSHKILVKSENFRQTLLIIFSDI